MRRWELDPLPYVVCMIFMSMVVTLAILGARHERKLQQLQTEAYNLGYAEFVIPEGKTKPEFRWIDDQSASNGGADVPARPADPEG